MLTVTSTLPTGSDPPIRLTGSRGSNLVKNLNLLTGPATSRSLCAQEDIDRSQITREIVDGARHVTSKKERPLFYDARYNMVHCPSRNDLCAVIGLCN